MRHRLSLFSSVLFGLAVACGGGNKATHNDAATDAPPDAGPTIDEACALSATNGCTKLMTCSMADLQKRFGDLATCEARETLTCTDALNAPGTANNPANVESCSSAEMTESCTDFLADKTIPTQCLTLAGSGSNGASCQFAAQCASAFCAVGTDELCGVCADQPVAGTDCTNQGCGQHLICVATTKLCQPPAEAGSACGTDFPCDDALTCVGSGLGSGALGSCVADIAAEGSACDPKHKTLPGCDADAGLFCDTLTSVCTVQPIQDAGSACGLLDGVENDCGSAATCEAGSGGVATGSGSGTCIATADDGADCDPSVGIDCLTPARCVPTGSGSSAGTCALPGSATCP